MHPPKTPGRLTEVQIVIYLNARELFNAAREASEDAEKCREQLDSMESAALRVSSPSFEPHTGGGSHDFIANMVCTMVDREDKLASRIEADYKIIDLATQVLYGADNSSGLAAIAPEWWADVLWFRFLASETWSKVASRVGRSSRRCIQVSHAALDLIDANGILSTMQGKSEATAAT